MLQIAVLSLAPPALRTTFSQKKKQKKRKPLEEVFERPESYKSRRVASEAKPLCARRSFKDLIFAPFFGVFFGEKSTHYYSIHTELLCIRTIL